MTSCRLLPVPKVAQFSPSTALSREKLAAAANLFVRKADPVPAVFKDEGGRMKQLLSKLLHFILPPSRQPYRCAQVVTCEFGYCPSLGFLCATSVFSVSRWLGFGGKSPQRHGEHRVAQKTIFKLAHHPHLQLGFLSYKLRYRQFLTICSHADRSTRSRRQHCRSVRLPSLNYIQVRMTKHRGSAHRDNRVPR